MTPHETTDAQESSGSPWTFPDTPEALHAWLRETLGLTVPRRPIVRGHQAPFAYVRHAFFEGGRLAFGITRPTDPPPLDCVVWANRGGGKTYLGAVVTMLDLVFKPGIDIRILGGSLEQSKRMHAHLRAIFAHPALEPLLDGRITEKRVRLRNRSSAEVLAQSETSVRGTRVQKLRCDEVELFKPDLWEAAQLTTRSATITLADGRSIEVRGAIECLSTMHRPYGLMQRIVQEARDRQRSLFRWGVVDALELCPKTRPCETCVLSPECKGRAKATSGRREGGHIGIEDAVRMKGRVGLGTWESEMLCRRPSRTDSVFPEFDPRVHVVGNTDAWQAPKGELLAGMDFGFRAPTVVLWAIHDAHDVLWVIAERVRTETVIQEHARAIVRGPGVEGREGPPDWIGVDPAGRQRNDQTGTSAIEVMRKAGLTVKDAALPTQAGLLAVRARLKPACGDTPGATPPPRLFVHARCTHLIECLERYHYPPDRPECDTPEKDGFDHAPDALRYLVQVLDRKFETKRSHY